MRRRHVAATWTIRNRPDLAWYQQAMICLIPAKRQRQVCSAVDVNTSRPGMVKNASIEQRRRWRCYSSEMTYPATDEIRALHERYAPTPEAFESVSSHCGIVWRIAEELLNGLNETAIDGNLVRAGSLLHDIGVYRLYDTNGNLDHENYVRHGLLGHEILAAEGLPETLCRFCSCHTGVGLTKHDVLCQQLPLPPADYLAVSEEKKPVMYADKFHSKTTPPVFVTAASYLAGVRRFGEDKVARFASMAEQFGEPDLTPLVSHYRHALV